MAKRTEVPNPDDIMRTLIKVGQELSAKNDELLVLSEKRAEAEAVYRIALAEKVLLLKAENTKVTIISDLARGDKQVAGLRFQRDVAVGVYEACRDRIRDLRTQIDVLRSILTWQRAEFETK